MPPGERFRRLWKFPFPRRCPVAPGLCASPVSGVRPMPVCSSFRCENRSRSHPHFHPAECFAGACTTRYRYQTADEERTAPEQAHCESNEKAPPHRLLLPSASRRHSRPGAIAEGLEPRIRREHVESQQPRHEHRNARYPQRLDFSKIPTSIQIPNLIEVQRRSYERFLQMDKLPQEREDNGLQSVFTSVFPITDFRNVSELEFVDYSIGNWECKCGYLKGLNHLRTACTNCGHMVITDPFHPGDVLCKFCGTYNKNTPDFCTKCGDPVGLQLKYDQAECEERGMTYSAPLKVTIRLKIYDKDPETGVKSLRDMKEQEVFFGDIPLMSPTAPSS